MAPADREFDVVVIGAGPAGMAAAWAAARQDGGSAGLRVAVVDDNPSAGGQIWRGRNAGELWFDRFAQSGAVLLAGHRVVGRGIDKQTLMMDSGPPLRFGRLILATGARELFLPFPGWTLPGVMGAGGLQAMVKGGLASHGRRVVVAGSGPLLLAVAATLADSGAEVLAVAEQAPGVRVRRLGLGLLWRDVAKLVEAAALRCRVPYRTDAWPVRALGDGRRLTAVELMVEGQLHLVECDYLACGFGLVPNNELAAHLGCTFDRGGFVRVDERQRTSQPAVFCAGEPTGIGGLDRALIEGQIAGYAAAGALGRADALAGERARADEWRAALDETFSLRPEVTRLAMADTPVCRCEEVNWGTLQAWRSWRAAKLQTRCGMGPCQGRVCGPALERLLGWSTAAVPDLVRVPLAPVEARVLGLADCDTHVSNR